MLDALDGAVASWLLLQLVHSFKQLRRAKQQTD